MIMLYKDTLTVGSIITDNTTNYNILPTYILPDHEAIKVKLIEAESRRTFIASVAHQLLEDLFLRLFVDSIQMLQIYKGFSKLAFK